MKAKSNISMLRQGSDEEEKKERKLEKLEKSALILDLPYPHAPSRKNKERQLISLRDWRSISLLLKLWKDAEYKNSMKELLTRRGVSYMKRL